ncbi:MAG: 50S ribosomal protein L9 [Alphaproteobacteria bacterium]|nr:50S ribosomal protein L9 [Alphaproteobacteria bacterium]
MEIILIERLQNLGQIGDKVKVKDGYARNYLIPQKKALRATKSNIAYFEAQRSEIEARNAEMRKVAEDKSKGLDKESVVLIRQASDDGRLYGSVTARDVATALQSKKHEVTHHHVDLGGVIKEVGIYPVKIAMHPEVIVEVKVNVARSESEAQAAAKAAAPKKKEQAPVAEEALVAETEADQAKDGEEDAA